MPSDESIRSEASVEPEKWLDDTVHAQLAHASMGLSPIALSLAFADWAMHLAVSPGRQMLLARRGMELSREAWSKALQPER